MSCQIKSTGMGGWSTTLLSADGYLWQNSGPQPAGQNAVRRWFVLHADAVLYSFNDQQVSAQNAPTHKCLAGHLYYLSHFSSCVASHC